jgi:hypothetical protein
MRGKADELSDAVGKWRNETGDDGGHGDIADLDLNDLVTIL